MKLTDKCEADFSEYVYSTLAISDNIACNKHDEYCNFYTLPESMQWGVLQDFADSKGYLTTVEPEWEFPNDLPTMFWSCYIFFQNDPGKEANYAFPFKTRQEARTAVIEKFNEIYNQS